MPKYLHTHSGTIVCQDFEEVPKGLALVAIGHGPAMGVFLVPEEAIHDHEDTENKDVLAFHNQQLAEAATRAHVAYLRAKDADADKDTVSALKKAYEAARDAAKTFNENLYPPKV